MNRVRAELATEMSVKIRTYLRGDMEIDRRVLEDWLKRYDQWSELSKKWDEQRVERAVSIDEELF